jgi:hypothetical protein
MRLELRQKRQMMMAGHETRREQAGAISAKILEKSFLPQFLSFVFFFYQWVRPSLGKNKSFKDTTDYEAGQKIFLMLLSHFLAAFEQVSYNVLYGGKTTGIKANDNW